jgi:CheY-like chemotaxis protein/HPt (histidine-containing phosphotransfer) domain-containing protein
MEALEILKTERFDLLFMDARMPGIDGLKATQFIRAEMMISETEMPVICISAAPVNEEWAKYQQAGMNAFLSKPFTEEMLLTIILSVIKDYAPLSKPVPVEEKTAPPVHGKINLSNLYHISGGDKQFVKQMLISFIESTQKGLTEISEAAKTGNMEPISDLAHKMLPPCRHVGALDLCSILREIEDNSKKDTQPESFDRLVEESLLEFSAISDLIRQDIAKIK